jgi:cobalt transporter subunit CbtA
MTRQIFASALFAGLAAGLLAALLQLWLVVPLILEAETFEGAPHSHDAATETTTEATLGDDGHAHEAEGTFWDTPRRHLSTIAMTVVTFTAFGLLLAAAMALAARSGHRIDARRGLVWGLAGFVALHLAPGLGLPPELPGTISAELEIRQIWWIATVACSALALALFAFGRGPAALGGGVALLALPHLIGAPHADGYFSIAPAELAAHYVATAYAVSAIGWVALGGVAGHFWTREA